MATDMPSPTSDRKPIVAIVGAGIAGLTIAILLEKQGIQYSVFERAKEVKPLGSAIALGSNVVPLFKQMGIHGQFVALGKATSGIEYYNEKREFQHKVTYPAAVEMGGAKSYTISRPAFCDILLRQVPKERFHMGQRVLSFEQDEKGVRITTSDGKVHQADILIGADGAHSSVRKGMYEELKAKKRLPAKDDLPLPFACVCLVGQTVKVDEGWFPDIKNEESPCINMFGDESPYACTTFSTKQNTICWSIMQYLDGERTKDHDSLLNAEWGPQAAEQMCNDVRDFEIHGAATAATPLTLGDLIDRTPKELISKVMLEEKVFKTWYHGRTVLMGDACHKFNPAGGQGALNAIYDAAALANWISVLPSTKLQDVEQIFREYTKERLPVAKAAFKTSQMYRNLGGQTLIAKAMRYLTRNIPEPIFKQFIAQLVAKRPQVSFLPLAQDTGTVKPEYQRSLQKTLKIRKAQNAVKGQSAVKVV